MLLKKHGQNKCLEIFSFKPKISHLNFDLKVVIIVIRFDLSFFTYVIIIFSIHINQLVISYWWPKFDK
jgi:hypothetical protein